MNTKILCIIGPTASGKTDHAIDIAKTRPCDIISVDSAMIYRGMDIGTAKPDAETLAAFPHALVDILDPVESYSAAQFAKDATTCIEEGIQNDRQPILVGGTMLYFKALFHGLSDLPTSDPAIRANLQTRLAEEGLQALHDQLAKIDPETAERLHPNDTQRILRALEVFEMTGKPLSAHFHEKPPARFQPEYKILMPERALLHERIEKRFDQMLELGFLDEVKTLMAREELHPDLPSMRSVGYRQAWEYLKGEIDFETFRHKAIAATRQLAKRQITWLRSWKA